MKKIIVLAAVLFLPSALFALNCKNLGITITNDTNSECVLKNSTLLYGVLYTGMVPITIPSQSTTTPFYLLQNYSGIGIRLDYRCDNNSLAFYSAQGRCGWSSGKIVAHALYGNDVNISSKIVLGHYSKSKPGQIFWTFY